MTDQKDTETIEPGSNLSDTARPTAATDIDRAASSVRSAEIVDTPYESDGEVHIPIEIPPTGRRETLSVRIPRTWSDSEPLVRLLESHGYGPGGLELLVDERVRIERRDGDWAIAPAPCRSDRPVDTDLSGSIGNVGRSIAQLVGFTAGLSILIVLAIPVALFAAVIGSLLASAMLATPALFLLGVTIFFAAFVSYEMGTVLSAAR